MSDGYESKPESEEVVQQIRTKEPQAPFGEDAPDPHVMSDETADDKDPSEREHPGTAGYAGRDPKTDMPRMPNQYETQEDPKSHDAEPPQTGGDRSPSD